MYFEEIGRQTLKSTKIRAKFCMFLALKIFWEAPPKFWLNILRNIVQNFAAIGLRSSEITRGKKEINHSKT